LSTKGSFRRSGHDGEVVTDELLRRAIFDPGVRKRRVQGRQAGLLIDVEDLLWALAELTSPHVASTEDLDEAVRRQGGHRVERVIGQLGRWALRRLTRDRWPRPARQQYWLDMYSWQKLRQHRE
jgi:hypothetical protein